MPTESYITRHPGDSITAEDWNDVQIKIKDDIAKQVKDAVDAKTHVADADNAATLDNKTPEELLKDLIEKAVVELHKHTGYRMYFKLLKVGTENIIEHNLGDAPLVDVYQLNYFPVICSEDDQKSDSWVNFYLYHSSEKKLRLEADKPAVEIESAKGPFRRILFSDMLARYKVQYNEDSTLDDLETEFWKALFSEPNDAFDDDQYCHSPWFDRCCGEKRTVADLKKAGSWDDIWFKMWPLKTINHPVPPSDVDPSPAPTQLQVEHFDFNTLGLLLAQDPILQVGLPDDFKGQVTAKHELKVMVLLNAGGGVRINTAPAEQKY
jgi:hypothetical protein